MNKKILFIINPISGKKKKKNIVEQIEKYIDENQFEYNIVKTQYAGHAYELAQEGIKNRTDVIVAVGGDGTVNEVGKALTGTDTIMGIIPKGSGNGLARFLKMPRKVKKAVKVINKLNYNPMDVIRVNEYNYLNVAGIGFDAHIAHLFAQSGKRGFQSYAKLVLKEFQKYQAQNYQLTIDGKKVEANNAFMISFANSSQFGNDAHIAPKAEINDGLMDVCILKKFPDFRSLEIIFRLYSRGLIKSKYYQIYKAKSVQLNYQTDILGHVDGEPVSFGKNLNIQIIPSSLKIIDNRIEN